MASGPHSAPPGKPDSEPVQLALDTGDARTASAASFRRGDPSGEAESTMEGTLDRVVFRDATTGWTVARLVPRDAGPDEQVTIVGALADVYEGAPVQVWGRWEENSRYGRQFRVRAHHSHVPETLVGLERYLGSKQFPGVGPEIAKRVVEHFGHDTKAVLDMHPERLKEVEGIGAKRAKEIAARWGEQRDKRDVKIFLHGYGISDAYTERIYKRYGRDAAALIRENPYRLANDIWGIGFKTADTIARNLGHAVTAPERLEAGLIHVLGQLGEDGHVFVPEPELLRAASELLEVDIRLLPPALDALERSQLVVRESIGDRGPCVWLTAMYENESEAAEAFVTLLDTPMRPLKLDVADVITAFERDAGLALASAQRRAIEAALLDKCVVITGGPGVGKTTIVRAIVTILAGQRRRIALAAPTGRAAKRLSESTSAEAVTLHRLLEFQPRLQTFARDEDNPLEVDALIIDEVSMVDIALFHAVMRALPPAAQLILVGDVDQLPSVGPGAVLADIIDSGAATVVRLTEIFRQAAQSRIITAAHEINQGILPVLEPPAGRDAHRSDFYFIPRDTPEHARDTIVALVAERIPESFGLSPMRDIQVLCPMHRGPLGTAAINEALQARLNPAGPHAVEIARGERVFRVGDKVMQIRNDYDKAVFNGDIGVIQHIAGADDPIMVDYLDGRLAAYKRDELDQLTHAYAVSVHKSQGSEYPAVVLVLAMQHYMMLQRNLLYTAITRGKQLVVIVGVRKAVALATRNQSTTTRWTWLAERIRAGMSGRE